MVSVVAMTTAREILQQCHQDGIPDHRATLIQGVTVLEPDMTVSEAGLEDGDDISLLWSDPFVEMERWTGRHQYITKLSGWPLVLLSPCCYAAFEESFFLRLS